MIWYKRRSFKLFACLKQSAVLANPQSFAMLHSGFISYPGRTKKRRSPRMPRTTWSTSSAKNLPKLPRISEGAWRRNYSSALNWQNWLRVKQTSVETIRYTLVYTSCACMLSPFQQPIWNPPNKNLTTNKNTQGWTVCQTTAATTSPAKTPIWILVHTHYIISGDEICNFM